ncbi:MAG: EscU/YscU/HrcU family type III secretion system export apparatus switch protein [Hyphomicrobiales bacterium]|nr:EscU/YscU/HrcU family type III secretion system export apparatus switch protein [Hyphomicrobiales bacterium]
MPDSEDLQEKNEATRAVALQYDRSADQAPRVVAKGEGFVAEQILALAKEHGVEVHQDADLAEILSTLELDSYIPMEAYVAVAEILSYIYRKNKERG